MSERGHWNRAGRRSGGNRPLLIRAGRTDGRKDEPATLVLDEDFLVALMAYGDAKKAVYECECEQGVCEHVTAMLDAARTIADRLVADPVPTPAGHRDGSE